MSRIPSFTFSDEVVDVEPEKTIQGYIFDTKARKFSKLEDKYSRRMPGYYEVTPYDISFVDFLNLVASIVSSNAHKFTRTALSVLVLWFVLFTFYLFLNALSLSIPIVTVFLIWFFSGYIGVYTIIIAVFGTVNLLYIMSRVVITQNFVPVLSTVLEVICRNERSHSWMLSFYRQRVNNLRQLVLDHKLLPEDTKFIKDGNDEDYSYFMNTLTSADFDLPTDLSYLLFVLHGPTKRSYLRDFLTVTLIFLGLIAGFVSNTVFAFSVRTYKFVKLFICLTILILYFDLDFSKLVTQYTLPVVMFAMSILNSFKSEGFKKWWSFIRLKRLQYSLTLLNLMISIRLLTFRYRGKGQSFNKAVSKFRATWNRMMMKAASVIDDIALPEFIRSVSDRLDTQEIDKTNEVLESLGWPKMVRTEKLDDSENYGKEHWLLGGFDFHTGVRQARMAVETELNDLREMAPLYMHSSQFQTVQNELLTTARYFTTRDYEYPDIHVDDVWPIVKEIFKNSRLTPFKSIISRWEKKYALGPFWKDYDARRDKKLPRWKAIKQMGGFKNLYRVWGETFRHAPTLIPVAGISVKSEALPPKKWQNDVVRTIVSAPLTHYIMSTVFNFQTNHNFKFSTTPIKIGMPLNGANLGRLFEEHSGYQHHFAGDFTAFDSTIAGPMIDIVKGIRKKGFENHRDFKRICYLIDHNYAEIEKRMPFAFTTTGKLYWKEGGLSTGHSATGMDNSVVLITLYVMMWKTITGRSASEFRHFNKLSCYGDDHILSWLSTAPESWTSANMIKCCAKWGLGLRDEAPNAKGVTDMEFLSKLARSPTASDADEMKKAGLQVPALIVYHNPSKLIGKATAPLKNFSYDYRYKRIISYIELTAHHKDIYLRLVRHANYLKPHTTVKLDVPTYEQVLKNWYNLDTRMNKDIDVDFDVDEDPLVSYGNANLLDQLFHALSVVPDLLNPVIFNQGYVDWLISRGGQRMSWPIELLRIANDCNTLSHVQAVGRKTPYEFLVANPHVYKYTSNEQSGGLLLKHWLFCLLRWPDNLTPKYIVLIRSITKKFSDLQFLINGKVWTDTYRAGIPLWDIFLVFALSFLPSFGGFGLVFELEIPNPLGIIDQVINGLISRLMHSLPPNFRDLHHDLAELGKSIKSFLVVAKTGVGKSTTMIAYFSMHLSARFDRIIVVSPRVIVAEATSAYFSRNFNIDSVAVTSTSPFTRMAKVMYVTAGEMFLHTGWVTRNTLVVIDESHLEEEMMFAAIKWVKAKGCCYILTTATPSQQNRKDVEREHELRMANVYEKVDFGSTTFNHENKAYCTSQEWSNAYYNYILEKIELFPSRAKFLVFVPTLNDCEVLRNKIKKKTCVLNSLNKNIDKTASVYVATSVADVGLTLPDLDFVITSDITRVMTADVSKRPVYVMADESLITQRIGRCGRTQNGMYCIFRFGPELKPEWLREPGAIVRPELGRALLKAGVPINAVELIDPDYVNKICGMDTEEDDFDMFLETFKSNFDAWNDVGLERWEGIPERELLKKGLTDAEMAEQPVEEAVVDPPLIIGNSPAFDAQNNHVTLEKFLDFVITAASGTAKHGITITPKMAKKYIRHRPIDAQEVVDRIVKIVTYPDFEVPDSFDVLPFDGPFIRDLSRSRPVQRTRFPMPETPAGTSGVNSRFSVLDLLNRQ
jgi:late competence protein required for DNA uptake (superfamily II DNA/RNA helicase)